MMKLHEKIYRLRTEKKMSQGDLAESLDVSRQSVSKWETGASIPDLDKLVKMSDLFGVTMDYLVREEREAVSENTQRSDEPVAQNTVIVKEVFPIRKLFGAILFVGAFILLFIAWPLSVFAAALGAICFIFRKHTLLWCAWFTYFSLDTFLVTGTAISRRAVFSPHAYGEYGIRMIVHWVYLLLLVALIGWTVLTFRRVRCALTARGRTGLALGWIVAFGVLPLIHFILSGWVGKKLMALTEAAGGVFTVGSELYEQYRFYVDLMGTVGFVTEWIQIVAFPILLVITVSLIHMRKERKVL
ncbi:MAG: helix-turn-helix transcriptional regulator [Clostridia bacterium]|nr:helix-turn-helix transcriptional regulator [Clostridia bacterium]